MIMDSFVKRRRFHMPKRTSELIALLAISSTLFLFLHTRELSTQLQQMRGRLPLSANQLTGENSGNSIESGVAGTLSQEANTFDKHLTSRPSQPHTHNIKIEYLPPSQLNNTQYADTEVVFFNRVPKVGSQTIMELLRRLSMINGFGFNRDTIQRVEYIRLSPPDQLQLALQVAAYEPPSVYIKHVCFTNFSQFGLPEPIYLNLVRDPVERVISWYYYVRAPWYYVERKQAFPDLPLPEPAWLKKDFETCVLNGDRECRYVEGERHEGIGDHRRQSLFFCGHDDECTPFNTVGALEKAKYAVEKHYAVVGVLEDINATLSVLEHYIPKFFRGASNVYWSEVNSFKRINRNNFKPPVSEHVKEIVRRNFTREIEFYQFCRQRLHKQLYALKLPETTIAP